MRKVVKRGDMNQRKGDTSRGKYTEGVWGKKREKKGGWIKLKKTRGGWEKGFARKSYEFGE